MKEKLFLLVALLTTTETRINNIGINKKAEEFKILCFLLC